MPLLSSKYEAPPIFHNKHLHTVVPSLLFSTHFNYSERERIELRDGDFIDIDCKKNSNSRVVLLLHGLEGNTETFYMKSTSEALFQNGFDIVAMNYRGCSGETNRLLNTYHSGKSEDISEIINKINERYKYEELYIAGFSLGGALLLKYLGEVPSQVAHNFVKGIAFSAPIDLSDAGIQIGTTFNGIYEKRFMKRLKNKLRGKLKEFPNELDEQVFNKFQTFEEFDNYYTAPTNGFLNAKDYYRLASVKPHLKQIKHDVLLISALDDPFLPKSCYPFEEAKNNKHLSFEAPQKGGHLGFITSFWKQETYLKERCLDYFKHIS